MKVRIEYAVPSHVAPLFVQIPRWNGRLNIFRGRPTDPARDSVAEAIVWQAIARGTEQRAPHAPILPGSRWKHETPVFCFDPACRLPIHGLTVWLGEHHEGQPFEHPFHPTCADQPWPLYETRRSIS